MSLIIKDKIQQLMIGYPTLANKYDVVPAMLEGETPADWGTPMMYGSETGRYVPLASASAITDLAGFVMSTNVQVPTTYPAPEVRHARPGEAFNLFVGHGGIALKLTTAVTTLTEIKEGMPVAIRFSDGALGTKTAISTGTVEAIPNAHFTGVYENHGTTDTPVYVAEVVFDI